MLEVTPGSRIVGASGKILLVDRVEGRSIFCGDRRISLDAVVQVIPPPTKFKLGDRVKYIGSDFNLKRQYARILEVWEISKNPYDGYTCLKSDGRLTSWIHFEDLALEVAQ